MKKKDYRIDLTIYFKNSGKGVPIEVKWSIEKFKKNNQTTHIQEQGGFVVTFGNKISNENNPHHILIDPNDFMKWVASNITGLTRESLRYQANLTNIGMENQYWIINLRGKAKKNFNRMIRQHLKNPFWAIKNDRHALKHIFEMQKGDYCLFLLAIDNEGQAISNNPNKKFDFTAWYETRITEPYYMLLKNEKGVFFEKPPDPKLPINKRQWPHFFDFKIVDKFESIKRVHFGERGEFADALKASAVNAAGSPAPLFRGQWDNLLDKLRYIRQSQPEQEKLKI